MLPYDTPSQSMQYNKLIHFIAPVFYWSLNCAHIVPLMDANLTYGTLGSLDE